MSENSTGSNKLKMSRRTVLATGCAAFGARMVPKVAQKLVERRILTLQYDKALGMMRAVERVVLR